MANQSRKHYAGAVNATESFDTSPAPCADDVYYLYAHTGKHIQSCVKIVGKVQAMAAFDYVRRNIAHLLGGERMVSYRSEYDCSDSLRDILDASYVSTRTRLSGTPIISEDGGFDMCFAHSIAVFFLVESPFPFVVASEMNAALMSLVSSGGIGDKLSALSGIIASGATGQKINGTDTALKVDVNNPECITEPVVGVIEELKERLDQPIPVVDADETVLPDEDSTPCFETDGLFVSLEKFANKTGYCEKTLKNYREERYGVLWLNDDHTLGKTKSGGHYIRKKELDNGIFEYEYFLFFDSKKNIPFMKSTKNKK